MARAATFARDLVTDLKILKPENPQNTFPLAVTELGIGYRDRGQDTRLASGISFRLPPGSLTAVVGVNGVGKSTLLRTLSGMHPPLEGSVYIKGSLLEKLNPMGKARLLSVVLTEPMASRNLLVSELVSLGRHPYTNWLGQLTKADRARVEDSLQKMELQEISSQPCHTLSDGQLQRVLIARALAQDTPLMLLDEPTTHLDLYHKVKILKLLREIAHTTDKAILFSTHEIGLAIQLCDQILVLHPGHARFGSPCELIEAGEFESLFPQDTIRFDPQSGMFRVQK